MSAWWIRVPVDYLVSRFPVRLYLPCAVFLALAGHAGGQPLSPAGMAGTGLFALPLLLQFRVLDDLGDLRQDRLAHPERVMVQAGTLAPFYLMLCGAFLANLTLVLVRQGPEHGLAVFLLLNASAVLWYAYARYILAGRILGYHVTLVKYPLFVYLLSGKGGEPRPLLLAALLVYLCFSVYEALHDRSLHVLSGVTTALYLEVAALFAVLALMTAGMWGGNPALVALQGMMSLAMLSALFKMFFSRPVDLSTLHTGYAIFILGIAAVANFSIGVQL